MLLLAFPPAVAEACEVATAAACAAAAAAAAAAAGFNAAGFEAWAAMGTSDVRSLKWHKIFQPFLRGTAHENLWPEFSFEFNYFGGEGCPMPMHAGWTKDPLQPEPDLVFLF